VCAGSVEVLDYKLDLKGCADSHTVLSDYNEEIRNSVILPKEAVSLLFEVQSSVLQVKTLSNITNSLTSLNNNPNSYNNNNNNTNNGVNSSGLSPAQTNGKKLLSSATPQLVISYKFLSPEHNNNNTTTSTTTTTTTIPTTTNNTSGTSLSPLLHLHSDIIGRVLTFTHKLRVARVRPDYIVQCSHPPTTHRGQRVKFSWTITQEICGSESGQSDDSESKRNSQSEKFSIKVDKALWIIASKGSGSFDLERVGPNRIAKIDCTLIALACGFLPPPTLCLDSVSPARVSDCTSKEDTVTVYPPVLVMSRCEKIEISEQKKEFWFSILDQQ